jgi:hypothetical protein
VASFTVIFQGGVPFFYVYQRGYLLLFTEWIGAVWVVRRLPVGLGKHLSV